MSVSLATIFFNRCWWILVKARFTPAIARGFIEKFVVGHGTADNLCTLVKDMLRDEGLKAGEVVEQENAAAFRLVLQVVDMEF